MKVDYLELFALTFLLLLSSCAQDEKSVPTTPDKSSNDVVGDARVDQGNNPPDARLSTHPEDPWVGETITADGSRSYDPDGSISSYGWDVAGPDGSTVSGYGATFSFTPTTSGQHTIQLTATDGDGATDTAKENVCVTGNNSCEQCDPSTCSWQDQACGDEGSRPNKGVTTVVNLQDAGVSYRADGTWNELEVSGGIGGVADFDGDGTTDIPFKKDFNVHYTDLQGNVRETGIPLYYIGGVGDFECDGTPELAHATKSYELAIGDVSGNVQILDDHTVQEVGGIGDFDGDGNAEVVYERKKNGGHKLAYVGLDKDVTVLDSVDSQHVGGMGDIDQDGTLEVAYVGSDDSLKYVDAYGGVEDTGVQANSPGAVSDVDGDGSPEIVYQRYYRGEKLHYWDYQDETSTELRNFYEPFWDMSVISWTDHCGGSDVNGCEPHERLQVYECQDATCPDGMQRCVDDSSCS